MATVKKRRCRWRLLHEYFQESMPEERCGICDNCRRGLDQLAQRPVAAAATTEAAIADKTADSEPQLSTGDLVSLPKYGSGYVEEIKSGALVVRFPDGHHRKFKREFARPLSRSRQKM